MTTPPSSSDGRPTYDAVDLALFALYVLFYAGFIWFSATQPLLMGKPVFQGANAAIVYGLGLIAGAILLAIAALFLHRPSDK